MEYKINSGDCMWNIVKDQYGDKVKTNADIQKAVNRLAEINNISNPNLIYAGNTLNIPSYESVFGSNEVSADAQTDDSLIEPTTTDEKMAVSTSLYEDFSNWIKSSYDKLMGGKRDEIEMYDYVESDISPNDENFKEPLIQGAKNIAASNLLEADSNGDGTMSYDEYLAQEVSQYNELFPQDAYKTDANTNELMTKNEKGEYEIDSYANNFMQENFSALDADNNGSLDEKELAAYYMALDASDSTKGYADGKIQIGAMINTDLTGNDFQTRYKNASKLLGESA